VRRNQRLLRGGSIYPCAPRGGGAYRLDRSAEYTEAHDL